MTGRDRIVAAVALAAAVLAGFWFVVLGPKRDDATALDATVASAQQRLQQAQSTLANGERAKRQYDADYAAVASLGAAVPNDDNVASLIVQLQAAARGSRIDFRGLKLAGGAGTSAPAPPAAAAQAAPGSSQASAAKASGSSPAPATQAAAATLPPGATVGPAGFPTMPFQFTFTGTFFDMERFLSAVQRFIVVNGNDVRVRGRLLTIDGVSLEPKGFPQVKANISATAYLLPSDQGAAGGSTAQAPTTAQPASGSAPAPALPAAAVTGVAR